MKIRVGIMQHSPASNTQNHGLNCEMHLWRLTKEVDFKQREFKQSYLAGRHLGKRPGFVPVHLPRVCVRNPIPLFGDDEVVSSNLATPGSSWRPHRPPRVRLTDTSALQWMVQLTGRKCLVWDLR